MAGLNVPTSFAMSGSSTANSGTSISGPCQQLSIVNRSGAGEVFLSIDGVTVPTVGGANLWFIPAAVSELIINISQGEQGEKNLFTPYIQAISASPLSLWVQVF